MTQDEALKLALEALELHLTHHEHGCVYLDPAVTAIKEALAQPEQKPVAFYVYKPTLPRGHLGNVSDGDLPWVYDQDPSSGYSARMLVYTTPPQRTWVGLTNNDLQPIAEEYRILFGSWVHDFARAIEAKLKEKNSA